MSIEVRTWRVPPTDTDGTMVRVFEGKTLKGTFPWDYGADDAHVAAVLLAYPGASVKPIASSATVGRAAVPNGYRFTVDAVPTPDAAGRARRRV